MLNPNNEDSDEEDEEIFTSNINTNINTNINANILNNNKKIDQKQSNQIQQPIRSILLQPPEEEDDDEDEDAPLPFSSQQITNSTLNNTLNSTIINSTLNNTQDITHLRTLQSDECIEALQAIESDCWDINSWILFIDEVEGGRGGDITIPKAYNKFLERFPRASKQWKALAESHTSNKEYNSAEEVYNKCLTKCRNVELWQSYIHMMKLKFPLDINQRLIENTYEKAVDNIGMSINSHLVWRSYIDYIKSWSDLDAGRKLGEETEWWNVFLDLFV